MNPLYQEIVKEINAIVGKEIAHIEFPGYIGVNARGSCLINFGNQDADVWYGSAYADIHDNGVWEYVDAINVFVDATIVDPKFVAGAIYVACMSYDRW